MSARIAPFVVAQRGGIILRPSGAARNLLCGCSGARRRWLVGSWRSPAFVIIEECLRCNATWTMADWPCPIPFHSPTAT